jgi:hypothetical protein
LIENCSNIVRDSGEVKKFEMESLDKQNKGLWGNLNDLANQMVNNIKNYNAPKTAANHGPKFAFCEAAGIDVPTVARHDANARIQQASKSLK